MKIFSVLFSVLFLLAMAPKAQAGFLFEPYVGYNLGSNNTQVIGFSATKGSINGIGGGAVLAYKLSNPLFFGVDGEFGSMKYKQTDPSITAADTDVTSTNAYAIAGFMFPMKLEIYGGYGVYNTVDIKASGTTSTYSSGTNFKAGLAYDIFHMVALKAEYIYNKPSRYKTNLTTEADLKNTYSAFDTSSFFVGVSFPFMAGGK